jgi:O-antigen/teichoic acid export membrane protein
MRNCLLRCLRDLIGWVLGGAGISGIVAYLLGVNIVVGTATIVAFPPGIVAALVAIGTVVVLGLLVSIGWCYARCARRSNQTTR